MALPRKQTRTITVAGERYLWHRSPVFESDSRWTVIQKQGCTGQLLMLDPYAAWSLGAGSVQRAIDFGLAHGWTPCVKAPPMKLRSAGHNETVEDFTILPAEAVVGGTRPDTPSPIAQEMQRKLGRWVHQQRKARHWSRTELHRRLYGYATTPRPIEALEAGVPPIRWLGLTRLAATFEIPLEQLLEEAELAPPALLDPADWIWLFNQLSAEEQQAVRQTITQVQHRQAGE